MLPPIDFYDISISWYSFCQYLGVFITSNFAIWYYYNKANFRLSLFQQIKLIVLLYSLLITGGRLLSFLDNFINYNRLPNWLMLFQFPSAGNLMWGGSILMTLVFLPVLSKRLLNIKDFNPIFNFTVLCLCCLTIWLKLGCFLEGDTCRGIPTSISWLGVHYLNSTKPSVLPLIPTALIVSIFHLFLFIFLLFIALKRKSKAGHISKIYFVVIAIFYLLLELIKNAPTLFYGFTLYQISYTCLLLFSINPVLLFSKMLSLAKYHNNY